MGGYVHDNFTEVAKEADSFRKKFTPTITLRN
jgi:hypothetical protein